MHQAQRMRSIDTVQARRALRSRAELLEGGYSERDIRAEIKEGRIIRVRRGWYVDSETWDELWPEGKHLLLIVAVNLGSFSRRSVFCGVSAAVLLDLPLYRTALSRAHIAVPRGKSRSAPDVLRHETALLRSDVVEVGGLLCTSSDRTVLDTTRVLSPEAAVSCADAALRRVAVSGHAYDQAIATEWHSRLERRSRAVSERGVRQARRVIGFADGRAQLPGESVSRLQLHRLGFRRIGLQAPVAMPDGKRYWIDFEFENENVFGEFDGRGKYLKDAQRSGLSLDEVLLNEKRREDNVRGVTGYRFVRWDSEHIVSADALGKRLASFGVLPMG